MIFLKNSNFIGVHSDKSVTEISYAKRMTILTGYNGAGKSTILNGIFLALDGVGQKVQRPLFSARKDWGVELTLLDDKFYENYKDSIPGIITPNSKVKITIKNIITKQYDFESVQRVSQKVSGKENLGIKEYYDYLVKELSSNQESANITKKVAREENSTNIFAINVGLVKTVYSDVSPIMNQYNQDLKSNIRKLSAAFYKDEQFFYTRGLNTPNNLSDLDVFSQNNNLDKSIFLLLSEFRKCVISSDDSLSEDLANEYLKSKEDFNYFDNNEIKSFFNNLLSKKRFTKEANYFLDKINLFFEQINKKVLLSDDGLIYFKEIIHKRSGVQEKEIQWYDCSKGEKNLICLLLIVFLYKDSNTIFIFDEPDLAMHVEWQRILLSTFLELAPKSQFFISTHSPALIPRDIEDVGFINVTKLKNSVEFEE